MDEKHPNLERDPQHEKDTTPSSPVSSGASQISLTENSVRSTKFEPIRPSTAASAHPSTTLHRERSNNGYGVDNLVDEDLEAADIESLHPPLNDNGTDPFEVTWTDGDLDPLNPRSLPSWRKWVIIGITSIGSFCVYVLSPVLILLPTFHLILTSHTQSPIPRIIISLASLLTSTSNPSPTLPQFQPPSSSVPIPFPVLSCMLTHTLPEPTAQQSTQPPTAPCSPNSTPPV